MNNEQLLFREKVIHTVRAYFLAHPAHEVITPVLHTAVPTEANIFPFITHWKTLEGRQTRYLPISPEATLKKALGAGLTDVYSIGHTFRNLESSGPRHSPEFLMLEWYRKNTNYRDVMNEVQMLIRSVAQAVSYAGTIDMQCEWRTLSLRDLFEKYVHISLDDVMTDDAMISFCTKKGFTVAGASWHELFDQLFLNEIEPQFDTSPFFLTDFPARISRLCAVQKKHPAYAERFELYIGGMELANGNTEETDSTKVRAYFEQVGLQRNQPIDEEFLSALDAMASASYAGIGLGVDRLIMLLSGIEHI